MACCFGGDVSESAARRRCREVLQKAVTDQLVNVGETPKLVDAIPTLGKTSSAARLAARLCEGERDTKLSYLTHLRSNRTQFEEMTRDFLTTEESLSLTHLPTLEEDCPTAMGEHGDQWKNRLTQLRNQGIAPSAIHRDESITLPCGGTECPYMDWWTTGEQTELLVGHVSHAYIPEVIEDRIVIIDEDPGDAFQTRFSASELHQIVDEYLDEHDGLPASNLDSIKLLRQDEETFADARTELRQHLATEDRLTLGTRLLRSGEGHADVAYALQTLLAETTPDEDDTPRREILQNDVEFTRINDSVVGAYDPDSGQLAIRRTPDLDPAAAVVGLDGTPTLELWQGRLGIQDLERIQVLCDDCRRTYLSNVLGYQLVQTSPYIKPYSGATADRVSFDKDRGLLHEVTQRAPHETGLITTKRVKNELIDREDGNEVQITDDLAGHFRNIRGSNEFAGDTIQYGVVIGSPNPGPDELRILAGLNGDAFSTQNIGQNRDGHHYSRREPTPEAEPYLRHVREYAVAQAILRFGREDGATVFVHTTAFPEWMQEMADEGTVERRSAGEQAVIRAMKTLEEATTKEVAEHTDFTPTAVRNHLKELAEEGIVQRQGPDYRFLWVAASTISDVSPTARISLPEDCFCPSE